MSQLFLDPTLAPAGWTADRPLDRDPLVVSYGMGVDSTAVLVEFARRALRPDLILFADTGSEKAATYAYRPVIDGFVAAVGFPPVTVVRYRPRHGRYETLEAECRRKGMLPSLAYGYKGCSLKWKAEPQTRFLKAWPMARQAWAEGRRIRHVIGYDAGPKDLRRGGHVTARVSARIPEDFWYPLQEWGWDRAHCAAEITRDPVIRRVAAAVGVPSVPPKSACFFCPSTKPEELDALRATEPDKLERIVALERAAAPRLTQIQGLWRRATRARPASMTEYLTGEPLDVGAASAGRSGT